MANNDNNNNNTAQQLAEIRLRLTELQSIIHGPNQPVSDDQLRDVETGLSELEHRLRYEILPTRRWEWDWLAIEVEKLKRQVHYRLEGMSDEDVFVADMQEAVKLADFADSMFTEIISQEIPPDDVIDITQFRTQLAHVTWLEDQEGEDQEQEQQLQLREAPVDVWPVDYSFRQIEQNPGHPPTQDEWFSWLQVPTDPNQPPSPYSVGQHNLILWFRRLGGPPLQAVDPVNGELDYRQTRFSVYTNIQLLPRRWMLPWDNNAQCQAPVWFQGPRVHVMTQTLYDRLDPAIDTLDEFIQQQYNDLNLALGIVDLNWRRFRQTFTDRPLLDHHRQQYQQVMDHLLRIRDRIRDEGREAIADIEDRLVMFTTPGGGGLIIGS